MNGVESKRRSRPVEETLAVWEEMQKGSEVGVANCLRFKINMQARLIAKLYLPWCQYNFARVILGC